MHEREIDINDIKQRIDKIHNHTGVYNNLKEDLNTILEMCEMKLQQIQDNNVHRSNIPQNRYDAKNLREITTNLISVFTYDCKELHKNYQDKTNFEEKIGRLYNEANYESEISLSPSARDSVRERAKLMAAYERLEKNPIQPAGGKPNNGINNENKNKSGRGFFAKAQNTIARQFHRERTPEEPSQTPKMKK